MIKSLLILLIICTSLTSCLSPKITYLEDKDNEFCKDIIAINGIIKSDKEIIGYFSNLQKDSLLFHSDSTLKIGFSRFIFLDLASMRREKDSSKNYEKHFCDLELEQEQYIKQRKEIKIECKIGKLSTMDADLEIKYWYEPTDRIYSVEIVNILKTPGFSAGYVVMIGKEANTLEIINRMSWVE